MKNNHTCKECGVHEIGNWIDSCAERLEREQLCFHCDFWYALIKIANDSRVARIEGCHYLIGVEPKPSDYKCSHYLGLGLGGSEFRIRFYDGREVITHNLWYQGEIPERFKSRLSDNAVFVESEELLHES